MTKPGLSPAQLTGREDSHVRTLDCGNRLQSPVAEAFDKLCADAREAGFELAIASGFRSFERQLAIWNGKAEGSRAVHDDSGRRLAVGELDGMQLVAAILRFSALPGASRHHWGTDLDVYDAAALPAGEKPGLTPQEVVPGGVFAPLHEWLDERMMAGASHGFHRPYSQDRGGVAPERWHLSYAPLSVHYEGLLTATVLRECWSSMAPAQALRLREEVEENLEQIMHRFVHVPAAWDLP